MPRLSHVATVLLSAAALTGVAGAQQPAPPLTMQNRPFSPGIEAGQTIYLSGHLGLLEATGKPPADPAEEATQVMLSVQKTLKDAGMTMDDLVYVGISCTDLTLYATFNKAYLTFFHKPYPAREFIGAQSLLFGAHYEVMGVAVRHASENKKATSPSAH